MDRPRETLGERGERVPCATLEWQSGGFYRCVQCGTEWVCTRRPTSKPQKRKPRQMPLKPRTGLPDKIIVKEVPAQN